MISEARLQALLDLGLAWLGNLAGAVLILVVGWFVAKYARRVIFKAGEQASLQASLVRFLSSIAQYAVLAITLFGALDRVGVQTASLIAAFASAGVAISLALQGSLSHLASGVMLVLFRPFDLGDLVKIGGETGKVADIGLFATRLVTLEGVKVIVPNSAITAATIVNYTGLGRRAGVVVLPFPGKVPVERARGALRDVVSGVSGVLTEPAPEITVTAATATGYELEVRVWTDSREFFPVMDRVRTGIVAVAEALRAT